MHMCETHKEGRTYFKRWVQKWRKPWAGRGRLTGCWARWRDSASHQGVGVAWAEWGRGWCWLEKDNLHGPQKRLAAASLNPILQRNHHALEQQSQPAPSNRNRGECLQHHSSSPSCTLFSRHRCRLRPGEINFAPPSSPQLAGRRVNLEHLPHTHTLPTRLCCLKADGESWPNGQFLIILAVWSWESHFNSWTLISFSLGERDEIRSSRRFLPNLTLPAASLYPLLDYNTRLGLARGREGRHWDCFSIVYVPFLEAASTNRLSLGT